MARVVTIPYAPRRIFGPYHRRAQRWACIVAHRRAGKTVACINDMVKRAVLSAQPHGRYAYVAPFLAQAKEVAWDYLKRYAQPIVKDKNEGELWVELINGARIRIHGADNPDRLRGPYLDGIVMDEYADMRPSVWGEVIGPMLADRQGWATFIGTPKGHNEFHALHEAAQGDPTWFSAVMKASETGIIPDLELAVWRDQMTPEQYEQEFECSFEAAILGAYFGKEMAEAQRRGRIGVVPYDPSLPAHTAWDLGNGDHMAIWVWQHGAPGEIRVVDFLQSYGYSMEKYCADLDARGYHGTDWVPHDAKVPSMETGKTRIETLIEMGRKPRLVALHEVEDGINGARVEFKRFWFDAVKCKDGLEALRQYRAEYDEKLKTFKDVPRKDWATHASDAFRYLAMAYREIAPAAAPPAGRMVETPRGPVFVAEVVKEEPTLDRLWELKERHQGARRI
jgi:hypothetical protein